MVQFGEDIDTDESVKDFKGSYETIEPGWKTVVITESTLKNTQTSGGKYLELKNELQDGSGRDITDRLNIVNKSEVAQKIGRAQLSKIAQCCGVKGKLSNSDVLHGRPYDVKIAIEEFKSNKKDENTGEYPMLKSNKITDYKPKGEGASAVPSSEPGEKKESSGEGSAW